MKALPILDERATGIDVGSERMHTSIGGGVPKVHGTMTCDVAALMAWLLEEGVRSVAMEATGVYWLYLYEALEAAGIEVLVVNGGKRRTRQARHRNRTGELFCTMARSLANSVDKGLGGFYRRLKARRGGLVTNKALARKLATMFWQVMVNGVEYVEQGLNAYQARVELTEQRLLRKLALKLDFEIVPKKPVQVAVRG